MGIISVKEKLYEAIELENPLLVKEILDKYPNLVNEPMTTDCQTTPLGRAAWRGSIHIMDLLIELGADVNEPGPQKLTPLMWATIKYKTEAVNFLISKGANIEYLSTENLRAIDYAVAHGSYSVAQIFIMKGQKPYNAEFYEKFSKTKKNFQYYNYKEMLEFLEKEVPRELCPPFHQLPPKQIKQFNDPVIDPRETWTQFFHRVKEFNDPPLIERSDLPLELQPQNRFFSRLRTFFNPNDPNVIVDKNKSSKYNDEFSKMNKTFESKASGASKEGNTNDSIQLETIMLKTPKGPAEYQALENFQK